MALLDKKLQKGYAMVSQRVRRTIASLTAFLLPFVVLAPRSYCQAVAAGGQAPPAADAASENHQKQVLEAAESLAKTVTGSTDVRYFQILEGVLKQAAKAQPSSAARAHMGHLPPPLQPVFDHGIHSQFAKARAEAQARAAALASIKNDPNWQRNQIKLIAERRRQSPGRIFGGVAAKPGEFPDCVAVGDGSRFCCTGTLIGPNVVVTAGHCVDGGCAKRIYVGLDSNSPAPADVYQVKSAVLHPSYNSFTLENDIGLLVLSAPVANAMPCEVATSDDIEAAFFLRLAGYGFTELGHFGVQSTVDVAIATASCGDAQNQGKFGCHAGMEIVAGGNGLDSCNGDSGGPAYIILDERRLLAGATSRATSNSVMPCGDGGIYSRVDKHWTWITNTAAQHGGTIGRAAPNRGAVSPGPSEKK